MVLDHAAERPEGRPRTAVRHDEVKGRQYEGHLLVRLVVLRCDSCLCTFCDVSLQTREIFFIPDWSQAIDSGLAR